MLCPFCKQKTLELIEGVFPYTEDHFQCNNCDSTYAYEEVMVKAGREGAAYKGIRKKKSFSTKQ